MITPPRSDLAPLFPVATAFASGIVLHNLLFNLWIAIFLLIAAIILIRFNRLYAILCGAAILGLANAYICDPTDIEDKICNRNLIFSGIVKQSKASDAAGNYIVSLRHAGIVRDSMTDIPNIEASIITPGNADAFSVGDEITFRSEFSHITAIRDLPYETDPAEFLSRQGIRISTLLTPEDIIAVSPAESLCTKSLISWPSRLQNQIVNAIHDSSLTPFAKEFLDASLVGATDYVSADMRDRFNSVGLSHILAISGLHVGLISLIISYALWPLTVLGFRRSKMIVIITSLWLFAFVTGLSPSAVRASIMATLFILGQLLQRRSSPLNTLSCSALMILLFSPQAIFSYSFQMSFAAVLSIIIFTPYLNPVSPRNRFMYYLMSYIAVSVSAMLGTGLLSAIYFHSFPVYFLLGNIPATLLLPILLSGGMIIGFAELLSMPHSLFTHIVNFTAEILDKYVNFIAGMPGSSITDIYLDAWTVIPLILLLYILYRAFLSESKRLKITAICGIATYIFILSLLPNVDADNRLYLSRDKHHTELIYPTSNGSLALITTTPHEIVNVTERARLRYRNYMLRHGLDSLIVDTTNSDSDHLLFFYGRSIGLLSGKPRTIPAHKMDYAILCRGIRTSIYEINNSYSPDTIILSYDLNPRRARRYIRECKSLEIPVIWTRNCPWSLKSPEIHE